MEIADRDKVIADSRLALLLEYWLPFSEIESTRRLGTWCDGIPLLTVADIHRTAFAVAGVGYFPNELSPFELNFYYNRRRDLQAERIEFRFGALDGHGDLLTFSSGKDPATIFTRRPSDVRHWAVAVELTPGDS